MSSFYTDNEELLEEEMASMSDEDIQAVEDLYDSLLTDEGK